MPAESAASGGASNAVQPMPTTAQEACVLLGVPVSAPFAVVKSHYNRAITRVHPDRGGSADAFLRVRRALEILRQEFHAASSAAAQPSKVERTSADKARAFYKARAYASAAAEFGNAAEEARGIHDDEKAAAMHANESASHLLDGDADAALGAADECVRTRPDWHKGHFRRAEAFAAMSELARARRSYAEALAILEGGGSDEADVQLLRRRIADVDARTARGEGARAGLGRAKPEGDTAPTFAYRGAKDDDGGGDGGGGGDDDEVSASKPQHAKGGGDGDGDDKVSTSDPQDAEDCNEANADDESSDFHRLGVPVDAPLNVCRSAYLKRVVESHPALAGSADDLALYRASFERIAESSMESLRDATAAAAQPRVQVNATNHPRIFLAMACYRDPEGIRSLASAFRNAANPRRVFAGVCWHYATTPEPKGEVTRAYLRVNRLTAKIEDEAQMIGGQGRDLDAEEKFLKKCMKHQRKLQKEEQRLEADCHTTAHPCFPAEFRSHVREVHEHYTQADGPSYARWIAHALWMGEEFTLQVDSHTRFVKDWDEILLRQYAACPHEKCVLTNHLLAYERAPKLGEDAQVTNGDDPMEDVARLPPPAERLPLVTCAHHWNLNTIDQSLAYMMARPLSRQKVQDLGGRPFPALYYVPHFAFAPSVAFQRDVPSDMHMAYLPTHAEALAMAARLKSHGYALMHCAECAAFTLYENRYRPLYYAEDARRGNRLYAERKEALGTEAEFMFRQEIRDLSFRRALQQCGVPFPGAAPTSDADGGLDELLGRYGLGPACEADEFLEDVGLDLRSGRIKGMARLGGLPPDALQPDRSPFLPTHWPTGNVSDSFVRS